MVGAKLESEGATIGDGLDDVHAAGTGGSRALEREEPDGAGADDGDGVAEANVGAARAVEGDGERFDDGGVEIVEAIGDGGEAADVGGDCGGEAAVGVPMRLPSWWGQSRA